MLSHGRLTGSQRLAVARQVWPEKAECTPGQLLTEMLDIEIVLRPGTVPGMPDRTRRAIEEAAKPYLPKEAQG